MRSLVLEEARQVVWRETPEPQRQHEREAIVRPLAVATCDLDQPMVFGQTTVKRLPLRPAMIPVFAHLAIVLMLGLWIPPFLADWYRSAAKLIG